jgi:hypothetical protein
MKTTDPTSNVQKDPNAVSDTLPPELLNRCAAIQDGDSQGVPLTRRDYVLFAVVTLILPAILVIVGAML